MIDPLMMMTKPTRGGASHTMTAGTQSVGPNDFYGWSRGVGWSGLSAMGALSPDNDLGTYSVDDIYSGPPTGAYIEVWFQGDTTGDTTSVLTIDGEDYSFGTYTSRAYYSTPNQTYYRWTKTGGHYVNGNDYGVSLA